MLRIVLGGEALADFPEGQEGGYIKLILPEEGQSISDLPQTALIELLAKKSVRVRSYTVRAFDAKACQLTLDFALHSNSYATLGPACEWAKHCTVGDNIIINGPGAVKLVDNAADWFFLAGDMTALPAISVNLEQLPEDAKGYAVIEVIDEADKQNIKAPEGVDIHWVINPHPDQANTLLADKVKSLAWPEGKPNVWVASEFESMRALRRYFKQERQVARGDIYVSSYWKMGDTDEGNKAAKKIDPEATL